jgi:Holliday junction resolvase RusA-like endonuclease
MATQTLVIPDWTPPTCNQLFRGRLRDRIRLAKEARQLIRGYTMGICPVAKSKRRVTLRIILGPRQKAADVDAYWKAVCDGLKHGEMIVDDSRQWCELAPVQYGRADRKRTEIVLEDV